MTELHDRELADRFVQRRDEEAFRLLFRRHSPRLFALACRLLGARRNDAEDVLQEAWLRAARRIGAFEWRSSLTTWLSAIVINCARERLRGRPEPMSMEEAPEPRTPVRGRVAATGIDLERAIAGLADGYREVLVLHDIEGFTHAEIARMLGIAEGTSKSQLFHARTHVRARMGESS